MYQFEYHRASSLDDAVAKLKGASDGVVVAGGQTLLPTLKFRLAQPSDVIDLNGIAELRGIQAGGGKVTIGAITTHDTVHRSPEVRNAIPALAELAGLIGDPAVRNLGTMGGSICNNDPAADYPAALVGLGATVHTTTRSIPADNFFTGLFETAREPDELVTKVEFPVAEKAAYQKFRNPASRYAIVGVFVARTGGGIRVAVTGAAPVVFRAKEMEEALGRDFSAKAIENIKIPATGLNSDIHASAEYRAHLVGVMARRAVAACT